MADQENPKPPPAILYEDTGGLAPLFAKATPVIEAHEPEITMRGLVEIFRRNRSAPA